CVAACLWGGRMCVEWVAGSPWNRWPDVHGISGRMAVEYADLVEARAKVQEELNSIARQRDEIRPRITSIQQRLQQLSTAQTVEQDVTRYEEQVRKICTALLTFINAQHASSSASIVEDVEAFVANASALSDYASNLRARWK
ncbi:alpha-xenorhabdolysin family binary toxin subunit B, partial [Pseudomonas sp. DSP3-2-2]|uniref:alpha-xenorhabdolysin family binary toxin subunit B n=1 Tax=unclassified Pseudomonas TaxID=196821 RepID=UPI003CF0721B